MCFPFEDPLFSSDAYSIAGESSSNTEGIQQNARHSRFSKTKNVAFHAMLKE